MHTVCRLLPNICVFDERKTSTDPKANTEVRLWRVEGIVRNMSGGPFAFMNVHEASACILHIVCHCSSKATGSFQGGRLTFLPNNPTLQVPTTCLFRISPNLTGESHLTGRTPRKPHGQAASTAAWRRGHLGADRRTGGELGWFSFLFWHWNGRDPRREPDGAGLFVATFLYEL